MKIFHTQDKAFNSLLVYFNERPKTIPKNSIMICDDKKPLAILCIYFDADICFIHGLFKSRVSNVREFFKACKIMEKYIALTIAKKFSIVSYTNFKSLKKLFLKHKFKSEEISMVYKECES